MDPPCRSCYETAVLSTADVPRHWLPIRAGIHFKLCLLVHHALKGQLPSYTAELLQSVTTRHPGLWSADDNALLIPRASLKFGERAFSVAGPAAWNSLPVDLRTTSITPAFKKKLRDFLLLEFYDITVHKQEKPPTADETAKPWFGMCLLRPTARKQSRPCSYNHGARTWPIS